MRFTKMQGVGNDFVVIGQDYGETIDDPAKIAIQICNRHFGVGADGLLLVIRSGISDYPIRMRMFNPDGTEDVCGNGLRCAGLYALSRGWVEDDQFYISTLEGDKLIRKIEIAYDHRYAIMGVDMGEPVFDPRRIPFTGIENEEVLDYNLQVDDRIFNIATVNTGSTHTVIIGPEPTEAEFQKYSPLIENHSLFPSRTSVLWTSVRPNSCNEVLDQSSAKVRIWERGVGETWGCGTGACAVGVVLRLKGYLHKGQTVNVNSKGGSLHITWPGKGNAVDMIGPAETIFEGHYSVD